MGLRWALSFPSLSHFCKVLVVRPMSLPNSLGEYMLSIHISYYISICLSTLFSPPIFNRVHDIPLHERCQVCTFTSSVCLFGPPVILVCCQWLVCRNQAKGSQCIVIS